jgi:hypothetical protein
VLALLRVVPLVAGILARERSDLVEHPLAPAAERADPELLRASACADVQDLARQHRRVQEQVVA